MLTTAVWYIILSTYVKSVARYSKKKYAFQFCAFESDLAVTVSRTTLIVSIWTLYLTLFTLVAVSRLYIAAHFPHQVVAGGISGGRVGGECEGERWQRLHAGLLVGWAFTKLRVSQLRPEHYGGAVLGMVLLIALAYATLLALGVDPAWSLAFARKRCVRPEWLRLNAMPLSALFRDLGAVAGLALARRLESDSVRLAVVIHRDGREIVTALVSFASVQVITSRPARSERNFAVCRSCAHTCPCRPSRSGFTTQPCS